MATTKAAGPVSNADLKSFADRLDNLEDERVAIGSDIKDVYASAKSAGYNTKALRKVLAERRKKTDAELEADMEMYRAALAEPGATYRSVSERFGVPKSNLQRRVPKSSRGTAKPEDGDDGITKSTAGPDAGAARSSAPPNKAPQVARIEEPTATPVPEGGEGTGTHSDESPTTPSVGAVGPQARVAPQIDDDEAMQAMLNEGAKWKTARASA